MNSGTNKPLLFALIAAVVVFGFLSYKNDRVWNNEKVDKPVINVDVKVEEERVVGERIVDLPEDGQVWTTVFVFPKNKESDPNSRKLVGYFASNPELRKLLAQTKTYDYSVDDELYKTRYQKYFGGDVPQFWLQKPSTNNPSRAHVVYKVSGDNIPNTSNEMVNDIVYQIKGWPCPRPKPEPQPTPQPDPTPDLVPDTVPDEEEKETIPFWVYVIPLLAALLGALVEYKKTKDF